MARPRWQFWIDRGGTFTDCIGRPPDVEPSETKALRVAKVLSSDRAPLVAIRSILGLAPGAPIPACDVRMGTTLATNALLERRGAAVGLVITRGFRDLLEIGTQARPHIFDLEIAKPELLYRSVLEVDARADAAGVVLERPDPAALAEGLTALRRQGIESLAIVVLHAYRGGELEREIAAAAERVGFGEISTSHEVAAELGLVGRGDTTLVDAYLTPLIRAYVQALSQELPGSHLSIMQSSGGLTSAASFRGRNAILSGPAAGVVACARVAEQAGFSRAIGFDMGGTSTDVSRWAGELERVYETETAGVRVRAPMMAIHTVAAGGGSICAFDGHRFTVGPDSAGAIPGPLCYGDERAKDLTITDVNLALGRLAGARFPFPLAKDRVDRALSALTLRLPGRSAEDIAEGFFRVANATMAAAIRKVSIARGHDVRGDVLVVFGGAGGQHACALARLLGMREILFHPFAGVLSAYGMGLADVTWDGELDAGRHLLGPETLRDAEPLFAELEARGRAVLSAEGISPEATGVVRRLELRYRGTETALAIRVEVDRPLRPAFEAEHHLRFGYTRAEHPIEVVTARVEVIGWAEPSAVPAGDGPGAVRRSRSGREWAEPSAVPAGEWAGAHAAPARGRPSPSGRAVDTLAPALPAAAGRTRLFRGGRWIDGVPLIEREALPAWSSMSGPAVILESTGTIVVDPGFALTTDGEGRIVLRDLEPEEAGSARGATVAEGPDPVELEIMGNLFMSIAEQMGIVLQRTALSTNIRERLDFSCAIFDENGGLVANAPHIPVHLGAMGESIKGVLRAHPEPRPGDVFVTNDPANGGSHLPDVTVVTPVHDPTGRLAFFTASRGHHADVGGITPGSMPPSSATLAEEGVVFRAVRAVARGVLAEAELLAILGGGPFPARAPRQNLADLEAQIAANNHGARLLLELVEARGDAVVSAYMRHVQENAALRVGDAISALPPGERSFEDHLDDGTPIRVTLRIEGRRMQLDFTGSGPEVPGNLNAPRAVTVAAVIYVLRALVGEPIPLNGGCLGPVTLIIPDRSVLSPGPTCAVAGGNVETSQRVVDVLLGALGRAAASQGTMNNLTFGDGAFGYYETIAGGAGATPHARGASAVHTHMTNTRLTDPEVLEARFPVRVRELSVRRGSGGRGRLPGGDGIVRELELLAPLTVSILSERRAKRPFGLEGGGPGERGRNLHNGRELPGKVTFTAEAGDRVRIETPGGGGFGDPSPQAGLRPGPGPRKIRPPAPRVPRRR